MAHYPFIIQIHPPIKPFSHFIQIIGAAVVFAPFHIHVSTVTVLNFYTKLSADKTGQFGDRSFPVIDAPHFNKAIDEFHQFDGTARPPAVGKRGDVAFVV